MERATVELVTREKPDELDDWRPAGITDLQRFALAAVAFAVSLAFSIVVWGAVLLAAGLALATVAQIVVFGLCIAVAGRLLF